MAQSRPDRVQVDSRAQQVRAVECRNPGGLTRFSPALSRQTFSKPVHLLFDPMCPRFLLVDTIKCAHEDHDLRLPTLRKDGQNWTLTDRVLPVMRCIYNHGQNEAIPAIRSMQNLRVTNYLHIITKKKPVTFRRQVKDISDGGFCLLANHAPKQSALLQGQLRLPRCLHRSPRSCKFVGLDRPSPRHYRIGLQYAI